MKSGVGRGVCVYVCACVCGFFFFLVLWSQPISCSFYLARGRAITRVYVCVCLCV